MARFVCLCVCVCRYINKIQAIAEQIVNELACGGGGRVHVAKASPKRKNVPPTRELRKSHKQKKRSVADRYNSRVFLPGPLPDQRPVASDHGTRHRPRCHRANRDHAQEVRDPEPDPLLPEGDGFAECSLSATVTNWRDDRAARC